MSDNKRGEAPEYYYNIFHSDRRLDSMSEAVYFVKQHLSVGRSSKQSHST